MNDDLKKCLTSVAALIAIFILCSALGSCCTEQDIRDYTYIYVDGQQYMTSDIVDISYIPLRYGNDAVTFKLKDGTVIRTQSNDYTLSN